jgi:hypothetical protein
VGCGMGTDGPLAASRRHARRNDASTVSGFFNTSSSSVVREGGSVEDGAAASVIGAARVQRFGRSGFRDFGVAFSLQGLTCCVPV